VRSGRPYHAFIAVVCGKSADPPRLSVIVDIASIGPVPKAAVSNRSKAIREEQEPSRAIRRRSYSRTMRQGALLRISRSCRSFCGSRN
jgi:hypothetical protein